MVVLNPAYCWDCPDCGKENFCRGIVAEMSPESMESLRAEYGVEPWEEGEFMMMPECVECRHCGVQFPTMHLKDA
jgi:hypothetical protein